MKRISTLSVRGINFALFTLVCCILSTSASAAPPGSCTPWPECKGDGGGDDSSYVATNSRNWVIWGDGFFEGLPYEIDPSYAIDAEPRACGGDDSEVTDPNPQGGAGLVCHQLAEFLYAQHPNPWNMVHLDFSGLAGDENFAATGVHDYLCDRLLYPYEDLGGDGYAPFEGYYPLIMVPKRDSPANILDPSPYDPDPWNIGRSYMYFASMDPTWNDGACIPGNEQNSCLVKIFISAYFYNDCNAKKCGRYITMEAWGHVEPNPNDPPREDGKIEINPFSVDQVIDVEELTVNFRGVRRDKVVASCYYNNVAERPIKFFTFVDYLPSP